MNGKGRVAVLLSGRGSNFVAIYRHSLVADANYQVVAVLSDKKNAAGLRRAKRLGILAFHVRPKDFPSKKEYEEKIVAILEEQRVELVCLAGYMRLAGDVLLQKYADRIMNIHPALLPAFPGMHAQQQALEHGVKVSGCTVHFIDSGVDTGPIILQKAVPVSETDSEDSLSRRILRQEHRLYAQAISLFFAGRLKREGRRVHITTDET